MPRAIEKVVDIELFIDDDRRRLFEKITQGNPTSTPSTPAKASSSEVSPDSSVPAQENTLSYYTVTGSSWIKSDTKSESKRVFEVEHLSIKYRYYAFILDGYIVCPAFLARSLEITDYACLNVIYGTNYFYIFVKVEITNPELYIAGNQFNFCGEHVLNLSLEGGDLDLSSKNMKKKRFLLYRGPHSTFGKEWNEVSKRINTKGNIGNIPIRSTVKRLYFYIPQKRFRQFEESHEAFAESVTLHNSCALMLEKSRTFSEINKLSIRRTYG
jgi:hypothetical protein